MRSRPQAEAPLGQLARFAAVGAANTALSAVAYVVLRRCGVPAPAAGAAAFALGAVNGYVWNGRWTFRARGVPARYVLVQAAGLLATAALLTVAGYAVVLPLVTALTFAGNRRWTFGPA